MYIPSNALELFENYKNYYQKDGSPVSCVYKTQMALLYCVIPMLGGVKPKGKRSTKNEIKAAMSLLENIPLEQFLNAAQSIKLFMEKENIPKNKQREYWTYLKKLLNWANEQQYIINKQPSFVDKSSGDLKLCPKNNTQVGDKSINIFSDNSPPKYSSDCNLRDYITFKLHKQLEDYRNFLIQERGLCEYKRSSVDINIAITKFLLKWLYNERKVSLDDLCLESIIPFINTKPKRTEYKDINGTVDQKSYLKAKKEFERQVTERNKETIFLVKSFLEFHAKGLSTRNNILLAIINIAKFLYKNDTNTKIARNFEDIEIIELLRKLRREEINNFKMARKSKVTRLKVSTKVLTECLEGL